VQLADKLEAKQAMEKAEGINGRKPTSNGKL
jgi:hypothetical protein